MLDRGLNGSLDVDVAPEVGSHLAAPDKPRTTHDPHGCVAAFFIRSRPEPELLDNDCRPIEEVNVAMPVLAVLRVHRADEDRVENRSAEERAGDLEVSGEGVDGVRNHGRRADELEVASVMDTVEFAGENACL